MQQVRSSHKEKHQIKALFLKNLHLQKRQPCTNCCQIMTPIICLILTILIRNAAIDNIPSQNDTIYASQPLIATQFSNYSLPDRMPEVIFREKQQWLVFQVDDPNDKAFVGKKGPNQHSGLLGSIPHTYNSYEWYNNSMTGHQWDGVWAIPPLFVQTNNINEELFNRYEFLNSDTFYSLRHSETAQHLPDGAVHFRKANKTHLDALLKVKDVRQFLFYRPNGISKIQMRASVQNGSRYNSYYTIPQGMLTVMDMISKAFVKQSTGKTVAAGYTYLPFNAEGSVFIDMLINTVATIIFPLALSLLLPVFLYLVVLEKEEKLIQMMRMNGMSILNYWTINFVYNLIISLATNLVFYLFGYIFLDISFFRQTGFGVLFLVFFGWILSQIAMSMFFQVFLSSSRAANIIGYLVAIWTNLVGATLSVAMFQYPVQLPTGFKMWPTFSFTRLFYLMFTQCSMDQCISNVSEITEEMKTCIIVLYVSAIVFAALGMYLFQVVPQEFGVSKPLLFPFQMCIEFFNNKNKHRKQQNEDNSQINFTQSDDTIEQQRQRINELEDYSVFPLVVDRLTKKYSNGKLAVDRLHLMVEDNNIFGLLGPNGAGKTTLLSMITGIFGPTSGTAYVGGHSIKDAIDKVHLEMGVCPQFDILWPTLTVEEHLYFYARLRGVSWKEEAQKVNDTLDEVNLKPQRHSKVTELSGGMKRRLSIGISLVGDPRIVFMDEPTTGLDPQNRRHLWQVLSKCRQKRAILLTTHLMQQAQSLCDRIAIITNGTLRTVGDQFKLKQLYGKGYFVSVSVQFNKDASFHISGSGCVSVENNHSLNEYQPDSLIRSKSESVITEKDTMQVDFLNKQFETQMRLKERLLLLFSPATVVKEIGGLVKICIEESKVSTILEGLRVLKEQEKGVNFEWSISDSTLEDVFLEVVTRYDKFEKASLIDSLDP